MIPRKAKPQVREERRWARVKGRSRQEVARRTNKIRVQDLTQHGKREPQQKDVRKDKKSWSLGKVMSWKGSSRMKTFP